MVALAVSAADAAASQAARVEIEQVVLDGATVGGSPVVDGVFGPAGFVTAPKATADIMEAVALAMVRLPYAVKLITYTVGTLPAAAGSAGAIVYVTDGAAGQPILAFSDGTNWMRCETRTPVRTTQYTVATVPAAASFVGHSIYVSNGAAGAPVLAFSNGANWLRCDTLAVIAAA
jgi:hypothetical protein